MFPVLVLPRAIASRTLSLSCSILLLPFTPFFNFILTLQLSSFCTRSLLGPFLYRPPYFFLSTPFLNPILTLQLSPSSPLFSILSIILRRFLCPPLASQLSFFLGRFIFAVDVLQWNRNGFVLHSRRSSHLGTLNAEITGTAPRPEPFELGYNGHSLVRFLRRRRSFSAREFNDRNARSVPIQ